MSIQGIFYDDVVDFHSFHRLRQGPEPSQSSRAGVSVIEIAVSRMRTDRRRRVVDHHRDVLYSSRLAPHRSEGEMHSALPVLGLTLPTPTRDAVRP